jgi:glycosyltransferase involved in cell wall biosynthesis
MIVDHLRSSHVHLPEIAVLVRVKNEIRALPEFLRRINSQIDRDKTELIFLDSGSTDGTLEWICEADCTIYRIAPENFGYGSSCNLLMRLSTAPVCVFLSGHVLLQRADSLAAIRHRLNVDKPAALYLRQVPGQIFGSTAYERAYLARRFPAGKKTISRQIPDSFSNAASAINRSAWERVPFPEVAASEDFLWAKKHLALGGRLEYLPQICVEHSHSESPEDVYRRVRINVESRRIGSSPAQAAKLFVGIFGSTLRHGASVSEAARYAASHARAYL